MLLNERIKQLRKERGLSQTQLARRMHLTQGAISQWENIYNAFHASYMMHIHLHPVSVEAPRSSIISRLFARFP